MEEGIWGKVIKITGSVGVVGLLLSIFLNKMFNAEIVELLGSEKIFYLLFVLTCGLLIALIFAVLKYKSKSSPEKHSLEMKENKVTYNNGSTHNGDNNF